MASEIKKYNYTILDTLIQQGHIFAIYKLPEVRSLNFIMQGDYIPTIIKDIVSLNGKDGFAAVPFAETSQSPILLIKPDISLQGKDEIFAYLENHFSISEKKSDRETAKCAETAEKSFSRYKQAFNEFHYAVSNGRCKKVVLSRKAEYNKESGFSAGETFRKACEKYPESFVSLFSSKATGTWLGSSPESILSGNGNEWKTMAIAGTMESTNDNTAIFWDEKNTNEQNIVSSYIENLLSDQGYEYLKRGPYTIKSGNLLHLKTDFSFKIKDCGKLGNILKSLHPTPAVCGYPKDESFDIIKEFEGYDRKYYSGFIGPVSTNGIASLFVNLRCMQIEEDLLTMYAGGGILQASELETEWKETEAKLQTMVSLIDNK